MHQVDVEDSIKAWGREQEAQGPLLADIAAFEGAQRIIKEGVLRECEESGSCHW